MTPSTLAIGLRMRTEELDDDRALVSAAKKDREAAGTLFDKHYGQVFGYIYHSTFDRLVTEDLTSNVFLSAFRHLGTFRWRRVPFRAWLFRIATNEIRMHYRRQQAVAAKHCGAVSAELPCDAPTAAQTVAATDDYRVLHRALMELRLKYRTVIVLHYLEGKSISEICDMTRKTEGTIKSQLHRGLSRLHEALEQFGVVPQ